MLLVVMRNAVKMEFVVENLLTVFVISFADSWTIAVQT